MIKRIAIAAMLLSTAACSSIRYRTITLTPPASLMQECAETPVTLKVNRDIIRKVRALKVDLKNCNADKAALRAWSDSMATKQVDSK